MGLCVRAMFLLALLTVPAGGALYGGRIVNNSHAQVVADDVDDHGVRRTVAVITREAADALEGPGQAEVVPCIHLPPQTRGERMNVDTFHGCGSSPLPAFPVIDLLGGNKALLGPCGREGKCIANAALVEVGGLWAGAILVELRLSGGLVETLRLSYSLQQYQTITLFIYVDTRDIAAFEIAVTVLGDSGAVLAREVASVNVVPQASERFAILDAVTRRTPRGYATYALGVARESSDVCLSPLPVPGEAAQRVGGRGSTAVFARYLTLKPSTMGFGPGLACADFPAAMAVRELPGGS